MNWALRYDTELHLGISLLGMSKAERLMYGESLMTHAMLFTAVQLKVSTLHMIQINLLKFKKIFVFLN